MNVPRHRFFGISLAVVAAVLLANAAHGAIAVPPQAQEWIWDSDLRPMFSPQVYAFLDGEKISLSVQNVTVEELVRAVSRRFVFTGPRFLVVGGGHRKVEGFSINNDNILRDMLILLSQWPGAYIETQDGGRGVVILHIPPLDPDA